MKNKKISVLLPIFVIGALMISLLACGDQSNKIIGKWEFIREQPDRGNTWQVGKITEFFDDGSYMHLGRSSPDQKWNVLKDGRIKIQLGDRTIFPVIQGDNLFLEYPNFGDGKITKEIYVRKK